MADMKCYKNCARCFKKINKPKILKCFHTFCEKCLEDQMQKTANSGKFYCPICVTEHLLPSEGVKIFYDNPYIDVFDLDATQKYYCRRHKEKELEFFCRTCRLTICASCSVIQDHKLHTTVDLADVHEEYQTSLSYKVETLKDKIQQCKAQNQTLQQNIDDLKETAVIKCTDVDKQVKKIHEEATRTGKGIKDEINILCQKGIEKLERQKHQKQVQIDQLETAVYCTEKALSTNTTKPLTEIAPHTQMITTESKEICLDIEEVKIPHFQITDFPKESMEKVFGELEFKSCATFTRRFNTEEIRGEGRVYFSAEQKIHDLQWCVGIKKFAETSIPMMGVHLFVNKAEGNDVKSCLAKFTAKLVHKADDEKSKIRKHLCRLEPGHAGYGWNAFIPWDDLIDPTNGFIDNKQLTLQITVCIIKIQ